MLRWKHCSKVIPQPAVCYCAVLSVVRKMSEAKVHVSMEQRIIIKLLTEGGCKPSEICLRLKRQYGEKTLSNVSVYKWSSAFKKGRETVENEHHERRPRTSITLATERLLPERQPQASGPLPQVYRKPGRLCWKVTISVSENNSTFWFYLQIIIHISPRLVHAY
jgi:hypothetical protein